MFPNLQKASRSIQSILGQTACKVGLKILQQGGYLKDVCLWLYCFMLSPVISLGAVPDHHLALSVKELTYSSNS